MAALQYPPVAEGFLGMFGCTSAAVVWENPSLGLFGIVVGSQPQQFRLPEHAPPAPRVRTTVTEVATALQIPSIPPEERATEPPCCAHRVPAVRRTVLRKDSANIGRLFYVCGASGGGDRCAFFRWADETEQFSRTRPRTPLSAADVLRATGEVDPAEQLEAWGAVQQGTERWHRLRACRVTASNFGSAHRTNTYCSPTDLLRNLLWPTSMDSVAMRYGSVNEKVALWRFSEWLTEHAEHPDLPIFIDEPGIWLSAQHPFLAGSPDGILYETLEAHATAADGGGTYYRCRRSLIEIKTPWKLRTRPVGGDFYPTCHQKNGRVNTIPCAYYDQVQGNAFLMGLGYIYFIVLSPSGLQVAVEPYDPVYVNQSLLPALVDFWHTQVLPAFEERDRLGLDNVSVGCIPAGCGAARGRKRTATEGGGDTPLAG